MNRASPLLLSLLCLGFMMDANAQYQPVSSSEAVASAAKELDFLCKQVTKADAEETESLKKPLSHDAEIALGSAANLLRFLSDPSTTYLDRLSVVLAKFYPPDTEFQSFASLMDDVQIRRRNATRAAALIGPEELPALWKTSAALQQTGAVRPSPCYYSMSANLGPRDWITRHGRLSIPGMAPKTLVVLGRQVTAPTTIADYPITLDDRNQAPWLWQLSRALPTLMRAVALRYSAPEIYPSLVETAWAWQPSNDSEKRMRADAAAEGPKNALWIDTVIRLILEEPAASYGLEARLANFSFYTPYHTEELLYAAHMVVLARNGDERVAAQIALQLERFRKVRPDATFGLPVTVRELKTATAILEVSQWATKPTLSLYNRYAEFAVQVCKMVDPTPFDCSKILLPQSPELIGTMNKFEEWLGMERESLQISANAERPWLDSLLQELHRSIE